MNLLSEYTKNAAYALVNRIDWDIYVMSGNLKIPEEYHYRKHGDFIADRRYKNWKVAHNWISHQRQKFNGEVK